MAGTRRGLLDHDPLRHRRTPRTDVSDRLQRHQRADHRRDRAGPGRLCEIAASTCSTAAIGCAGPPSTTGGGCPTLLRNSLRYAASLAAVRRAVRGNHGRGRIPGPFSRRLPQHARVVLRRAPFSVRLRNHHHGQPQSAQRQRREGLRRQRRAVRAAPRRRFDRADAARHVRQTHFLCQGVGRRPDSLLPGRGGRRFHPGGVEAERARPAQI